MNVYKLSDIVAGIRAKSLDYVPKSVESCREKFPDTGGTVTGRFSSRGPNFSNPPKQGFATGGFVPSPFGRRKLEKSLFVDRQFNKEWLFPFRYGTQGRLMGPASDVVKVDFADLEMRVAALFLNKKSYAQKMIDRFHEVFPEYPREDLYAVLGSILGCDRQKAKEEVIKSMYGGKSRIKVISVHDSLIFEVQDEDGDRTP